mmetsp:Transcript_26714/g.61385  ORF Transcript_26714/g.61385 Transcript_26714/m.61385 type:complete len:201 (+) Transcript_26714:3-605(+)
MTMMKSFAIAFVALLAWTANGFSPIATTPTPVRVSALSSASSSASSSSSRSCDNTEISRRVALVQSVAMATGTILTAPNGAHAAATATTLAQKVAQIEAENLAEVNSKGAPEKHLPQITVAKSQVQVVIPHVMDPEKPHYIEYVWLQNAATGEIVAAQAYEATSASPPTLTATVGGDGSSYQALSFCNLHGLWEGPVFTA